MVLCACGKQIDKVPNWLRSAKVEFVCNNCPNRQTKNIAFMTLEANAKDPGKSIDPDGPPMEDMDEEED